MTSPVVSSVEAVGDPTEVSAGLAVEELKVVIKKAIGYHRDALRARRLGYGDLAGSYVERRNSAARKAAETARRIVAAWSGDAVVESLVYQAMSPAEHGCIEWHRWA